MSTHFTPFRPVAWTDTFQDCARQRTTQLASLPNADVTGFAEVVMRATWAPLSAAWASPPTRRRLISLIGSYAELLTGRTAAESLSRGRRALTARTRYNLSSALTFTVTRDGDLRLE